MDTDEGTPDRSWDIIWEAFETWPEGVNLGDHCDQYVTGLSREALELVAARLLTDAIADMDDEINEDNEEDDRETCRQLFDEPVVPSKPLLN